MAKQTYVIREFHGGVNSNADPRDVTQEESPDIKAGITNLGKLTTQGEFDTGTTTGANITSETVRREGLFVMGSDRKVSDNSVNDESLIFLHDVNNENIDVLDSGGWSTSEIVLANSSARPVFFAADGVLRIGDANDYNLTDWYGYIGRTLFSSLDAATVLNNWYNENAKCANPVSGQCLISTPFKADDTTGVNSNKLEYIGAVGSSLMNTNSLNLRVGVNIEDSIKGTGDGLNASDCTADYPTSTDFSPNLDDYKNYSGGTDGTYTAAEDVYPFLFDNNILVGKKKAQATSLGNYSAIETNVSDNPSLEYAINEKKSLIVPVYFWELEYDRVVKVIIQIGALTIQEQEKKVYVFEFGVDQLKIGWNVLVCEAGMHTSVIGEPPPYGEPFTYFSCKVENDNQESSGVVTVDNSFPKWYLSGPALIKRIGATGYGPGTYSFYYTFLYDEEEQESKLFKFSHVDPSTEPKELNQVTIAGGSVLFNYDMYIKPTSDLNPRIVGAKLYYKKKEDDSHYLIGQTDFIDKGFKFFPEAETYEYSFANVIDNTSNLDDAVVIKGVTPEASNLIDTYKSLNGFYSKIDSLSARWKTATIQGRRAYVGNVQQGGENYPDRMLKSMVNKFDIFPNKDSVIDVAIRDGENIIKLESYADRILQFKEKTLYIINVAQGSEFLEDIHPFKGIANEYHSTKTDRGIAFFNEFGAYIYDGRAIVNLLEKEGRTVISEDTWKSFVTTSAIEKTTIGYAPKKHQILFHNYSGVVYIYNMKLGAWTFTDNTVDDIRNYDARKITKMALDENNNAFFMAAETGTGNLYATSFKYDHTPSNTNHFTYITKDIDFGDPSIRKKIYKVYITYRSGDPSMGTGNLPNIKCLYDVNGGTEYNKTFKAGTNYSEYFTGQTGAYFSLDPATSWTTAELKPATSSQANNIYSFSLKIVNNSNIRSNTAQATGGSPTNQITLDSSASAIDDYYNNMKLTIWKSPDSDFNNTVKVTDYIGSSKIATVSPSFSTAPDTNSKFVVGLIPSDFEINDITIVYRAKSVK
tara:strand:+ start:2588 stop:5695 length:3108 start_codon:yes stop_codon:yes gene_type:complete